MLIGKRLCGKAVNGIGSLLKRLELGGVLIVKARASVST